jgi:hypothetical protein
VPICIARTWQGLIGGAIISSVIHGGSHAKARRMALSRPGRLPRTVFSAFLRRARAVYSLSHERARRSPYHNPHPLLARYMSRNFRTFSGSQSVRFGGHQASAGLLTELCRLDIYICVHVCVERILVVGKLFSLNTWEML